MSDTFQNTLYCGDNLEILREYIPDESVDLIYLDPPFNSNRDYNVLFREESGEESEAQVVAFKDTWHWDKTANATYHELLTSQRVPERVSRLIGALHDILGTNQMLAYLVMMTARLVELHRVLKPTGSLYLHCDTNASTYLQMVLNAIFGVENFRNQIIWRRSQPKGHAKKRLPRSYDTIFYYVKSDAAPLYTPRGKHNPEYIRKFYKYVEPETGRRYRLDNLANPNDKRPNLTYEFPPGSGVVRVWRWTKERMMQAWQEGRVVLPPNGKVVAYKRYLDEVEGTPLTDTWMDIEHLHGNNKENVGYPTQKPLALLERIIQMSSREGDVVLDPFCGCGTAIVAAQQLGRRWIGIDITHLAIAMNRYRLKDRFGDSVSYRVVRVPKDLASAQELAKADRYQFQWWALSLVAARPRGGETSGKTGKRGADSGIDGVIIFTDEEKGKPKRVLVQVKSGSVRVNDIREFKDVLAREKAEIGIFITLKPPTEPMRQEALKAGYYHSERWNKDYPRLQILTVEELLKGAEPLLPPNNITFRQDRPAPINGEQHVLV
ncbi:MAG: DNA methyltransferase [Anaerolineae bacterium]|nr:DNA methyltransferase [Anaerolineae bacterium]MDW8298400.1 DNA methyltransferase [Anaerolineae bacterium]